MLAQRNIPLLHGARSTDRAITDSIDFLDHLLLSYPRRDFRVRLWDGTVWGGNKCRFTLVLKHPGALQRMFASRSELTLGEVYIFDDFDIEGDIEASFDLADFLLSHELPTTTKLYLSMILGRLPATGRPREVPRRLRLRGAVHTRHRDRDAISFHYDLPPEFYSLFLDRRMLYSCAYFHAAEDGLEQAQEQKLEYICKKLRLRPGDHLLDIGCGWGALTIHATAHYGVHALGISLSAPQVEWARQRIHDSGLDGRCSVEVRDYRDLGVGQQFDKIVSVGMIEHVGEAQLPEYFSRIWRLLRPGGAFLNSGITATDRICPRGEPLYS